MFVYGDLASSDHRRERAFFREGGVNALAARLASGDAGPPTSARRACTRRRARRWSVRGRRWSRSTSSSAPRTSRSRRQSRPKVRERNGGLPGVRAIGVKLATRGVAQVSTNVHDPFKVTLADVVEAVRSEAEPLGQAIVAAELVGLAPGSGAGRVPRGRRAARLRRAAPHPREAPARRASTYNSRMADTAQAQEAQGDAGRQRAAEPPRHGRAPRPGAARPPSSAARSGRTSRRRGRGAIGRGALAAVQPVRAARAAAQGAGRRRDRPLAAGRRDLHARPST